MINCGPENALGNRVAVDHRSELTCGLSMAQTRGRLHHDAKLSAIEFVLDSASVERDTWPRTVRPNQQVFNLVGLPWIEVLRLNDAKIPNPYEPQRGRHLLVDCLELEDELVPTDNGGAQEVLVVQIHHPPTDCLDLDERYVKLRDPNTEELHLTTATVGVPSSTSRPHP